jgi:hypothetical protein
MKGNAASMRLRLGPFAYSESAGADHRYDRRKFLMAVAVAWLVTQPGLCERWSGLDICHP